MAFLLQQFSTQEEAYTEGQLDVFDTHFIFFGVGTNSYLVYDVWNSMCLMSCLMAARLGPAANRRCITHSDLVSWYCIGQALLRK